MYRKRFMQAAAVAFGLISLSAIAAQDFSGLGTTELTQLKPSEMNDGDRNAFRAEMQKRSVNMSSAEKDETRNQMREQKKGQGGGQGRGGMEGGGGMGRGR
ncbi:hypothetical protein SCT_1619 [Sulfuricella sp. T08]|uniref:hypothetical protein n=1 Tax=Sulfuricella sp. T08 TaxID=1632857 RepID=UPI000617A08F|nr:hypothetical protein [Sulfuricella sp. T08]GAO36217.1 hypothetical protein SCT_1619 [Sulfuricella sp. T08]